MSKTATLTAILHAARTPSAPPRGSTTVFHAGRRQDRRFIRLGRDQSFEVLKLK
jgi:hypothetical protein